MKFYCSLHKSWIWCFIIPLLFFTACGSNPTTISVQQQFQSKIKIAEQTWAAKRITDYRIEVSYFPEYFADKPVFEVIVKSSKPIQKSVIITPSPTNHGTHITPLVFDPNEYTVQGLFSIAKNQIQTLTSDKTLDITFDSIYGFPTMIKIEPNEYTD